jgi:flagellar motor switch protein FliN/FliY
MTPERSSVHAVPPVLPSAQIISLGELPPATPKPADASALGPDNPLHAVRARLQVSVGQVELTVGELLAAKEHQVLVLDRQVDQPVDLLLEGKVVARGQLVAMDGRFALRITELPVPLKP